MEIETRLMQKYDTEANWKNNNPILLIGEIALSVLDDGTIRGKVGNGISHFNSLPYSLGHSNWELKVLTQDEYEALITKDANTLYVIEV